MNIKLGKSWLSKKPLKKGLEKLSWSFTKCTMEKSKVCMFNSPDKSWIENASKVGYIKCRLDKIEGLNKLPQSLPSILLFGSNAIDWRTNMNRRKKGVMSDEFSCFVTISFGNTLLPIVCDANLCVRRYEVSVWFMSNRRGKRQGGQLAFWNSLSENTGDICNYHIDYFYNYAACELWLKRF